ncbi:30S ribosomal protein S17 [Minwuia thermotolerans]|jgi:small subunit ribosomal protein S17|uniref:Small ribosomal subunit protein uS17 n=1 Tax=Minwuia thermotolerans TaxID=2056226 RepID=A0A2M9FYF6_9PROT|nr:30S ribosomal protein S17 [Minwuia thermotolerans]ANK83135.1 MAG: 30S ribosomal protein S17 [Rhizobiales bacterium NRL2]PJK28491.1 30S ribosomal protein S17 [Minwuia thermotolerans]
MPKRVMQGVAVSDANDKTVVIRVERRVSHPLYKKIIRHSKKIHAHDPENSCKVGDTVRVIECAPYSKLKRWEVVATNVSNEAG